MKSNRSRDGRLVTLLHTMTKAARAKTSGFILARAKGLYLPPQANAAAYEHVAPFPFGNIQSPPCNP